MLTRVVLLLGGLRAALGQVLGVDVGTEFWKAGLISPGRSFVIVENSKSDRKSHNSVAIKDGERHFEEEAIKIGSRYANSGFFSLKKYF
jgi:hypoxia up-regulated 1